MRYPRLRRPCTLRAAIIKANHYRGGGVTINLRAGTYTLTIAPTGSDDEMSGDLNITNTLTINGEGADSTFIDANGIDRVLSVRAGAVVVINNVTIRNGEVTNVGGGIDNNGVLTLNHVIVSGNSSGANSAGGGISNSGVLTLNDTVVRGNTGGNAGGIYNDNLSRATLNYSVVSDNVTMAGGYGGGIDNAGDLTLNNSLVSNNQTTLIGGGLSTSGKGGGIFNATGMLTVANSTISNNSANSDGGGILNWSNLNTYFATIAGNLADDNVGGFGTGGGIYNNGGSVNLRTTIVGQNYAGTNADDCRGTLGERGYSLIEHAPVVCTINVSGPGNLAAAPSLLDSLKDNGGLSQTRALFAGSPLIDVIPALSCDDPNGVPLTVDQRGFARPVGGACDVGAYEGSVGQGLLGVNLIRNGDAEGSASSPSATIVGMPYWSSNAAIVAYDSFGFPLSTDPGPSNRGHNFFGGGISTNLTTG